MENPFSKYLGLFIIIITGPFILNSQVTAQDNSKLFPALPDNVNKIVSFSCVPCHTSTGGLMSRSKLNFTEWAGYSTGKQKAKAEKMFTVLKKSSMPPKSARETRPEIIPTDEQIEIIKKWAESLPSGEK